jgi:NitT/TauT family transport system ATP-binding protein/nitrate/nitrite transport system substrate-binding protein
MTTDRIDTGDTPIIHAGFIPLTDSAPLLIAKALRFDAQFGFDLRLHREVSWANIRDKTDHGIFDCAHMLAPMPIASTLGLGRAPVAMIAPMALNLNGNAITVSSTLYAAMADADPAPTQAGGMAAARALAKVVRLREANGQPPLTLGMVYPFSCHNYDLRYWLASAGIDPDNDVTLVVIPPPLIAEGLAAGHVDGHCVGAPWGAVSVENGGGHIVATKQELWAGSPEKVLGVRMGWAERNPGLLTSLIGALLTAAQWLDRPENLDEASEVLCRPENIGVDAALIRRGLAGKLIRHPGGEPSDDADFIVFHRYAANFPWVSHAIWLLTQMRRWGQITQPVDMAAVARQVYRPDLYRAAAMELGFSVPLADLKLEGGTQAAVPGDRGDILLGPSRYFDGETFDSDAVLADLQV